MWMRILTGELAGQKFTLKPGDNYVGRAPDCQIVLNLNGISKKHACIHLQGNEITITDLRSSNGTYVNGIRILKQYIRSEDKVSFHNVIADFKPHTSTRPALPIFETPSVDGANALHPVSVTTPEPQEEPQNLWDKFQKYINEVAMPGIYHLGETFEYRLVIGGMILSFIILMTFFSVLPMIKLTKNTVESESRRRALTIARNLATVNQSYLQQGLETAVSTKFAEREEGVQVSLIISNRDGHVIAPTMNLGEYPDQPFVHKARKESRELVEQIDDELIGAAVPISTYSAEAGPQIVAHAVVLYNMGSLAIDSERYIGLFSQILLISLILGFVLYFFLVKLFEEPILRMSSQLDEALKDDAKNLESKFQIPPLKILINNINSLLHRTSQASGHNLQIVDYTTEASNIVRVMVNPAAVFDVDQIFMSVNTPFEDLIGMRLLTIQGQSFEILQDQALKASLQDLVSRSTESPGLIVTHQLDFSGVPYEIDLQSVQNQNGIAYFLLSMKKQGEA